MTTKLKKKPPALEGAFATDRKVPRRTALIDDFHSFELPKPKLPLKSEPSCDEHAKAIHAALAKYKLPVPSGYNVLIAVFKRPDKTKGGIILSDQTRDEDKFQGRCGLVLALGPDAYAGDKYRTFSSAWVRVGDWVIWPLMDNAATRFEYGGVVLAVLPDDKMLAKVADPMDVY